MPTTPCRSLFTILLLASCAASPETKAPSESRSASSHAPEGASFEVVPLRYAAAQELANVLTRSLDGIAARVVADPRTNSVIVQAAPEDMTKILELIARLDVEQK